jgi:hydroxymethylglutaryl-CoA lyase
MAAGRSGPGRTRLDVTSFVSRSKMPQFSDAEQMLQACLAIPDIEASVLTLNARGAERALEAGARHLVYVLSASAAHSRSNAGRDTDAALQEFAEVAAMVKALDPSRRPRVEAGIATAFGCTLEGTVPADRVCALASRLAELGADEIMLADTVGYAQPRQVLALFKQVRQDIGSLPLGGYFHDTRGLALANVAAALEAGVRKFDAALGGLGRSPSAPGVSGNVATEDLVYLLESMGLSTGVDLQGLMALRGRLSQWLPGASQYGAVARAGLPKNFALTA